MKQSISYLGLCCRSSFYRLLGIVILLGAAQWLLFLRAAPEAGWLDSAVQQSKNALAVALIFGFVLTALVLSLRPGGTGNRSDYSFSRLGVSNTAQYFLRVGYNFAAVLVFWTAEVMLLLSMLVWFEQSEYNQLAGPQNIFVEVWRWELLHSLLPMTEWSRWLRNLCLLVGFGFVTAAVGHWPATDSRSKRSAALLGAYVMFVLVSFVRSMGNWGGDGWCCLISAVAVVIALTCVFGKEEEGFRLLCSERAQL